MANDMSYLVRGADGKFYQEMETPQGTEYLEIKLEPGSHVKLVAEGRYQVIRDPNVAARQAEDDSHEEFMQNRKLMSVLTEEEIRGMSEADQKVVRQRMKRQEAYQRQFEQMALDRIEIPHGAKIERVKDERWLDMLRTYQEAVKVGQERSLDYAPLNTYVHKLQTKTGKIIRPLYKGEVGIRPNGVVICLEDGYGQGHTVAIPSGLKG